jgi:hypothetical protein
MSSTPTNDELAALGALAYLRSLLTSTVAMAGRDQFLTPDQVGPRVQAGVAALETLSQYLTGYQTGDGHRRHFGEVVRSLITLDQIDETVYLSDGGYSRLVLALPVENDQDPVCLSGVAQAPVRRRWAHLRGLNA